VSQDRDFTLELDGQPGSYRLHVSSPAGDDSVDVGLDPASLGVDLDSLQARVLASAPVSRVARVPELERPLREVGQALFDAVFQASAGALFLSSRNEAERAGERLRIVLRLHPPELAVLPWELLFSEYHGGYLCRRSPMVRYIDAPEPVRPLTVAPPLRVLGMTALPGDLAALDADTEQRRLQQLLAPLQARGLIAVDWVPGQSWEAAQGALYAGCQVFHFIGHGGFDPDRGEGVIAFADERGRRQLVGASALAELLSVADPMPRLVMLNSCQTAAGAATDVFSSTAATLVRTVPGVVAMQFAVTDDAASVFSGAFYQALVNNRGVDEAVRAGRIALTGWNPETLEWVTPVLYLRSRDTLLFDFTHPSETADHADDQPQPEREAVFAAYWAARSTDDWAPVIAQLGALRRQSPGDREVEEAYQDARVAARYAQGRRAEQEQDWPGAVSHYQAIFDAQPEYRDVAARLVESQHRRDIAALQKQLRVMFTTGEFQAVVGIASRLAELDPTAADPDGLVTQAQQQVEQLTGYMASTGSTQAITPEPGHGAAPTKPVFDAAGVRSAPHVPQPRILHFDEDVYAVAVSTDGARLATGHRSRARIWNLQTGAAAGRMRAGTDYNAVHAVAFSPDGTRLATCSGDNTVRIWDAATGKRQLQVIHGRVGKLAGRWIPFSELVLLSLTPYSLVRVAFSPHGTRLATGSGNTVRIWDAATGKQRLHLTHGEPILAFSSDKTAQVSDATAGQQQLRLTRSQPVLAVAFSPDGTRLATGSGDNTVRIWDATSGQHQLQVAHDEPVCAVAFSPDGTRLAAGSGTTVRIWDATSGQQQLQVAHGEPVRVVAFSPDGTRLAAGSGTTARIWDATSGQQHLLVTYGDTVQAVAFSSDGSRLATGRGKVAQVWNIFS
jgi:hypothetical protein